jgi:hypothetical protein
MSIVSSEAIDLKLFTIRVHPANIETKMVKAGDIVLMRDQCACGGGALPLANSPLKVPAAFS